MSTSVRGYEAGMETTTPRRLDRPAAARNGRARRATGGSEPCRDGKAHSVWNDSCVFDRDAETLFSSAAAVSGDDRFVSRMGTMRNGR
jgi:hypothetical protein